MEVFITETLKKEVELETNTQQEIEVDSTVPQEKYEIKITEILEKVVTVEATNQEDAFEIVEDRYNTEVYVLDASDFAEVKFSLA